MAAQILKKLPLFSIPDTPITASTQEHLPIADIIDDIVIYKDGGACVVLESTSLNFGLLSETEKESVIAAYAALINSLSFPVQIVIRTQRKDITSYINYLNSQLEKVKGEKMRSLFNSYRDFVIETTQKRNVLGKRFFLVILFSPLELGVGTSMKTFANKSAKSLPYTKEYVLKKAKVALIPKKDHLTRQASRLGLKLTQLDVEQLTQLYYDVYNPREDAVKERPEPKVQTETQESTAQNNQLNEVTQPVQQS